MSSSARTKAGQGHVPIRRRPRQQCPRVAHAWDTHGNWAVRETDGQTDGTDTGLGGELGEGREEGE